MKRKYNEGFSLLEVLVAAVIIAVMTSVGVVSYGSVLRKSRDSRRTSDIEQLRQSLEMYRSDFGYYPGAGGGTSWVNLSLSTNALRTALVPTYLPTIPQDPKNSATYPYEYRATDVNSGQFYGYCVTARLETQAATNPVTMTNFCTNNNAALAIPNGYTYGVKSP